MEPKGKPGQKRILLLRARRAPWPFSFLFLPAIGGSDGLILGVPVFVAAFFFFFSFELSVGSINFLSYCDG
jgi:hypothetical protein